MSKGLIELYEQTGISCAKIKEYAKLYKNFLKHIFKATPLKSSIGSTPWGLKN